GGGGTRCRGCVRRAGGGRAPGRPGVRRPRPQLAVPLRRAGRRRPRRRRAGGRGGQDPALGGLRAPAGVADPGEGAPAPPADGALAGRARRARSRGAPGRRRGAAPGDRARGGPARARGGLV
ncbi:MAG: hypothetical protein AVDCRST_MAG35-1675, partial [uncultured Quadrisphaera sp.]